MKILLLGGTTEARRIANHLNLRDDLEATLSLAGATEPSRDYGIAVRVGGFGGADGLMGWLCDNDIELLIDATHPYAQVISASAAAAADKLNLKRWTLWRPPWHPQEGDVWQECADWDSLIGHLPQSATVFVAAGQEGIDAITARKRVNTIVARAMKKPETPLPANVKFICAAPPAHWEDEADLLKAEGVTHIIAKNSGGAASSAKLEAARKLNLPVLMLMRPPPPPPPLFDGADTIIAALEEI